MAPVLVRATLAWWWGALARPEPFETDRLVSNWFAGHGFVYRFLGVDYRSLHSLVPYSLLYAAVYGLSGGSPGANLVAQWVFAALLCVVVWHLGVRMGGPRVAGLANEPRELANDRLARFHRVLHLGGTHAEQTLVACSPAS